MLRVAACSKGWSLTLENDAENVMHNVQIKACNGLHNVHSPWSWRQSSLRQNKNKLQMRTHSLIHVVTPGTTTVKLRVVGVTERADGTLWANANINPVINMAGSSLTKDALLAAIKARDWAAIPAGAYMRLGVNAGNASEALTPSAFAARVESELTPEQRATREAARANAAKARVYDALQNEGGEGYNPYRQPAWPIDCTPYQKGDDAQ